MFKSEGTFHVTITKALLGEAKFCNDPGAFDVCIEVQDANGISDWWRGEYSNRPGVGNAANRPRWEITMETLKKLGLPSDNLFDHLQPDASGIATIPCLVGIQTDATVKATERDGKTYFNVQYLGEGGNTPKGVNLASLFAAYGIAANPAAQPAPAAPAAVPAAVPAAPAAPQIPAFPGSASGNTAAAPNGPFAHLKR